MLSESGHGDVWSYGAHEFSFYQASRAEPAAQADAPNSVAVLCWLGPGAPLSGIPLAVMTKLTQAELDRLLDQTYYSWNTSVMLSGIVDFLEFSESNLEWQRRREIRKAREQGEAAEFEPEDEHLAETYRQHLIDGAEYRFDVSLSQRVRYAALVAFVTTLEWCAMALKRRLVIPAPKTPDGENKQVHVFSLLNDRSAAGYHTHISDLRRLIHVRNCIVHAGGFVDGDRNPAQVRDAVANLAGFGISDKNYLGTTVRIEEGAIERYADAARHWVPRLDELCTNAGVLST